jgi:hypothetical protein
MYVHMRLVLVTGVLTMASTAPTADDSAPIDDSLYSRQRYVYDDNSMRRLARSNVFVYGLSGLGIEAG